ncbi:MAG: LysM peptidoglycan-binding domain-containing protein [Clostridiales bacterium]|nr:LysM peptidoglycan-binding domain-containing protein [Clostridiales bacterium]
MGNENRNDITLPRNIRQIGAFDGKYRVYIEDFVYTYVHRFIHQRRHSETVLAAVLLGKSVSDGDREYIFISGAQKVDFGSAEEMPGFSEPKQPAGAADELREDRKFAQERGAETAEKRQAEFWDRAYQRIKQSFEEVDVLGWYFNLDGSCLAISPQVQQFFESTFRKGSRFLYLEDCLEQEDAFFVQEQHKLQRLSGYAVYYERNPQMQQFMIEEKERLTPKPLREDIQQRERDDVVQNYRAIMSKLNEKPPKRKLQPALYLAGAAVMVIAAATAVTQIGSYQNLKLLQQTMQTLSGAVDAEDPDAAAEDMAAADDAESGSADAETADDSGDAGVAAAEDSLTSDTDASGNDGTAAAEDPDVSTADVTAEAAEETAQNSDTSTGNVAETVETGTALPDYYVVQKGDNLMAISQSVYNTTEKVDEICALNGIEDMNMIYEGQTLLLP